MHTNKIAVLFAREDSIYKTIYGLDVFDIKRDARNFDGGQVVIAHPPCRAWGRLRKLAKPRADEKDLALFAVDKVRSCGGVLEHPEASSLWLAAGLPKPRQGGIDFDIYGGWTMPLAQSWFGHRAEKRTWLYIVGLMPGSIPDFPLFLGDSSHVICQNSKTRKIRPRPQVTLAEREHTPCEFANWLVELAKNIQLNISKSIEFCEVLNATH